MFFIIAILLAVGCSSNPADSNDDDPEALGSGTLTVMDETWEFEVYHCAFSPEEAGNENVLFVLNGGDSDLDLRVDATRQIGFDGTERDEEADPLDSISFVIGDMTDPELNLQANWGTDGLQDTAFLNIDGNEVTATAHFVDENEDTDGLPTEHKGVFEATCPGN